MKNNLVKNEQTITSLEIAEISKMQHKHLLRSIRHQEVAWEKVNRLKFGLIEYTDLKGRKYPMYSLTKMESLYISSKFNDEIRARLVMRWHELEIKSQTPINGVYPLIRQNLIGYPRKELLVSIGRSPRNAYKLRKRFPNECFTIAGVPCLSERLAQNILSLQIAQQSQLDLFNNQKAISQ